LLRSNTPAGYPKTLTEMNERASGTTDD
jgi:hypothetical protein